METESSQGAPAVPRFREQPVVSSENGRYDFEIDLESDSTHAKVVRLVGSDRRVLELGPATGYMSHVLRDQGCSVVGIELDPDMAAQAAPYCERMIVGDLDTLDLATELGEDRFDAIVAADVLEHLKDPLAALRRLRGLLAEGGYFVISLPNVAHGSVRLALLEGHFPYQKQGLLDETHLRFFTRESVEQMLDEAELGIAEIHYQRLHLDASEVPFDPSAVSSEVLADLERDPDAETYQFVIKAIPFETHGLRELQRRMRSLAEDNAQLRDVIAHKDAEIELLREVEPQLRTLQESLAAISGREGQLRASLIDAHEQLLQRDEQLNQLREELLPLRQTFDRLRATPIGRAYVKLRRLRRMMGALSRRAQRYRAALRKL